MRYISILILVLSACAGGPINQLMRLVTLDGLDTAPKVLARLGDPCWVDGSRGGPEEWHYCAAQCPPPDAADWCMGDCVKPCADREWVFYITAGIVTHVDGPYSTPPWPASPCRHPVTARWNSKSH